MWLLLANLAYAEPHFSLTALFDSLVRKIAMLCSHASFTFAKNRKAMKDGLEASRDMLRKVLEGQKRLRAEFKWLTKVHEGLEKRGQMRSASRFSCEEHDSVQLQYAF